MDKELIREIVKQHLLQEVSIAKQKHPFKAILMTGPAGSGKSYTSKNLLGIPGEVLRFTVNADEIIEDIFPRFGLPLKFIQSDKDPIGVAQAQMRKVAQIATKSKALGYINRAKPLYIDTTGENVAKMAGVLNSLVKLGYDVGIIKVFVPKETSIGRDAARKRTIGSELTGEIWDDYYKNVVQDKRYEDLARRNPNIKVLNSEPFYNVFNLSDKDVMDKEGNLIAKARSAVEDVKGEVPVSVEEMDKVITNLRQEVQAFLAPKEITNPVGNSLYRGMTALLDLSAGKLGNEITDLYTAAIDFPEETLSEPAIKGAVDTLSKITGEEDLEKSFQALAKIAIRASRGGEERETAPLAKDIVAKAKEAGAPLEEKYQQVAETVAKKVMERLKKN